MTVMSVIKRDGINSDNDVTMEEFMGSLNVEKITK